jgi:prepilin-type N-terminal cleavage/methylation domain-containing protein
MNRHRAFTLVELLVTVCIGSSVMLASVTLVHRSFTLHRQASEELQHQLRVNRWTAQMRRDGCTSTAANLVSSQQLELTTADGQIITYSFREGHLWRERAVREDEESVSSPNVTSHVERLRLDAAATATFSVRFSPERIVLQIAKQLDPRIGRPSAESASPGAVARIERQVVAVLGSWLPNHDDRSAP